MDLLAIALSSPIIVRSQFLINLFFIALSRAIQPGKVPVTLDLRLNMVGKGGRTATTWSGGWNSGKTTSFRVPIALKDDILAYARKVDFKLINDKTTNIPLLSGDFLQEFTMQLIDRYIKYKRTIYHPNQNSRELDISTRPWDELRRFQKLIQKSPELLS